MTKQKKNTSGFQIMIKNRLRSFYGDTASKLVLGDVRAAMAESTIAQCERLVDKYYGKMDKLWILIHSNPDVGDRKIIRTKIIVMKQQPPRMLGTVCFLVDYRISDVDLLWALPLDTYRDPAVATDTVTDRIVDDAKGLPIIH
jgi:hypothetical protein